MDRREMLRRVAEAHTAWSLEHGDDVSYVAEDASPHDGQVTDLAVWQADRSAPPEVDDPLNAALKDLIAAIDE